eukprot:1007473-Pyramimonas_sp.AAC.1
MALAAAGDLEPLTPCAVSRAARVFKADAAVGIDCWPPRMLASPPGAAVGAYADLLNQCEA